MLQAHLRSASLASFSRVGALPHQLSRLAGLTAGMAAHARAASTESSAGASEELLSRIKDKDLVKTLGFVGGDWTPASDGSTYAVSVVEHQSR